MDVGDWLRRIGFGQYEAAFRDKEIDHQVLPQLTGDDLKELGVASVGHRRKLLTAIAALTTPGFGLDGSNVLPPGESTLKPPGVSAERRPITVMFCDLVGSTGLAASLDAEDWRNLVSTYLDEASAAVTGVGGHVLQRLGDGLMALFGYPLAQENDAERAVRAALAIQRALADLNARHAGSGAPELAARIGIDAGPVVVDAAGAVFGDTPNIAARVQSLAEPGSVLITTNVQRQVAGLFVVEEKGARELKGLSARVQLFKIVRASGGGRRRGARALTPLVGREEELAILKRRWERALAGNGQLVLIVGEPGLGKSRLVEEFRSKLGVAAHTFVEWRASQLLQNTPLHPIAEWGRQRFGTETPAEQRLADLEGTLRLIGHDPAENTPLLAPLVDIPLPPGRAANMSPEELRRRQLAALTAWVLAGARSQAVALAFEDLHWADPTSLDLLETLAERGAQAPLLIIATARPEFRPPWSLRSHHSVISLSPLARAEVAEMVGELAQRHALSEEMIDGVNDRTGGVPLFVEEVTRLLLERGEQGGVQAIPLTLQQSLAARLDRLGPAREIAQIGAVLGREFSYALLRAVAAVADRGQGLSEAAIQSALDHLADADLLYVEGVPPQANYRFKHALIQDAAYNLLLRDRKRQLHARIVEILESKFGEIAENKPELLAHHCAEAGYFEKAAVLWGKAGRRSAKRSALVESTEQLRRALDLIVGLPSNSDLRREEIKLQVELITPLLHLRGYASPETKAAVERAHHLIEQSKALGETPEDPYLLFIVLYGSWVARLVAFDGDVVHELAVQFLALAEKQAATGPLMIGHRLKGMSLLHTGEIAEARAHLDRAIALYDPAEHRHLATRFGQDVGASILAWRSLDLLLLGYSDAALVDTKQALETAREGAHVATLMYVLNFSVFQQIHCGHFAVANAYVDELNVLKDQTGGVFWGGWGLALRGSVLTLTGEAEEAARNIASGVAAIRSTGNTMWTPLFLSYLAWANGRIGRLDDAWTNIREAMTAVETTKERWCEAEISRIAGEVGLLRPGPDTAKAETSFARALEIARKQQAKAWELRAAMSMARLLRAQGKQSAAHELLSPIYNWFTQGFDTLDLREAKTLLDELAAGCRR
jgi:class 3 adenylate cyclase/predicted ATPase